MKSMIAAALLVAPAAAKSDKCARTGGPGGHRVRPTPRAPHAPGSFATWAIAHGKTYATRDETVLRR